MPFLIIAGLGVLFLISMGSTDAPPLPNPSGPPSLPPANGGGGASGGLTPEQGQAVAETIAGVAGSALAVLIPAIMAPVPATATVVVVTPPAAAVASTASTVALSAALTATIVVVIIVIVIIITVSIIVSVIEGNALYQERFEILTRQNFQFRASQEELFGEIPDYTDSFRVSTFMDGAWLGNLAKIYPTLIIKPTPVGDVGDFAVNTFRDAGGLQGIVDKIIPWQRRVLFVDTAPDSQAALAVKVVQSKSSVGNIR